MLQHKCSSVISDYFLKESKTPEVRFQLQGVCALHNPGTGGYAPLNAVVLCQITANMSPNLPEVPFPHCGVSACPEAQ